MLAPKPAKVLPLSAIAELTQPIIDRGLDAREYLLERGVPVATASSIVNERRLAFFHIPKTAGATTIAVLDQYFDSEEIAYAYNPPDFEVVSDDKRLFRGHIYGEQKRRRFPDAEGFTIGREPTALMRSMFYWMREQTDWDEQAIAAGKIQSDDAWLRADSEEARSHSIGMSFLEALTCNIPQVRERLIGIYARILTDASIPTEETRRGLINEAATCIDNCCAVATVEDLEMGISFLCEHRHWPAPPPLPKIHLRNPKSTVEEDALSARLAKDSGDVELYDRICRRAEAQHQQLVARCGGRSNLRSYLDDAHKTHFFSKAEAAAAIAYAADQFWPGYNWGFRLKTSPDKETKQFGASGQSTLLAKMLPNNEYVVTLTVVRAPPDLPLNTIRAALGEKPLRRIGTNYREHGVDLVWHISRDLIGDGELEIVFAAPIPAENFELGAVSVLLSPFAAPRE